MNSLTTIEQANISQFWNVVSQLDPELYLVASALQQTQVNPLIIPRIIRSIHNMYIGTGYGKITMYMQAGKITMIEGMEKDKIDEMAIEVLEK